MIEKVSTPHVTTNIVPIHDPPPSQVAAWRCLWVKLLQPPCKVEKEQPDAADIDYPVYHLSEKQLRYETVTAELNHSRNKINNDKNGK